MAGLHETKKGLNFSVESIKFLNDGKEQRITHHVQNSTAASKKIRSALSKGTDKCFSLVQGKEEKVLAAGLRQPVVLCYSPKDSNSHSGDIELFMDDKLQMTVPIISNPPSASISYFPAIVKFGDIAPNHQTVTETLSVCNNGLASGNFCLNTSSLPTYITVSPTEGVLKPHEDIVIKVNLLCRKVCSFKEQISITLDNNATYEVIVIGNIVPVKLELMSQPNLTPLDVLHLGTIYYGSSVKKTVTLYNNSPLDTKFITMMDIDNDGHEQGVNLSGELSLACTTGGLHQSTWKEQGTSPSPSKMLSISPAEGTLSPYETRKVEITFTPSFVISEKGWEQYQGLMSQRDYALFVKFNPVGESISASIVNERGVELGVTATVLPVIITSIPAKQLHFGSCTTGLVQQKELKLTNESDTLNANFKIRLPAHYKVNLSKGVLKPGETLPINIIFNPKQFGLLQGTLHIDVYGEGDKEVPVYVHTVNVIGRGTVNGGLKRNSHKKKTLANVNDLSCSIRPHDQRMEVITPYTKFGRHSYIDPDYALTDKEVANRTNHRSYYSNYVKEQQTNRIKRKNEMKLGNPIYSNDKDIGIQPAAGLNPPKLSLCSSNGEAESNNTPKDTVWSIDTQRTAINNELVLVKTPYIKPCSFKMAEQCQTILNPRELSLIEIDPAVIEMTIVRTIKEERDLLVKNHLTQSLLCKIKIVGSHIQLLSAGEGKIEWVSVLAPRSCTPVTLELLYDTCGQYHQTVEFTINRDHHFQVPVSVTITDITIVPSCSMFTVSQHPLSTHNTHLQGSLSLYNPHNVPAHFSWNLHEHLDYLMVSNHEGIIPAKSSIYCHFQYIEEGQELQSLVLTLEIKNGKSFEIICKPEYAKSDCSFKETVIFFNPASLYLTCRKTITCINKGLNHAYFKVLGCHPPIQGAVVSPMIGNVTAGGETQLSFELTATELGSFESWLKIQLKEGKTMTVRVTGSVELPKVYINLNDFMFGNVYCGSTASIPFTIHNKGCSQVHLTFNFTSLPDFKVTLPVNSDPYKDGSDLSTFSTADGIYQVVLSSQSTINCILQFSPTNIAAYDFITPILINGQEPISPPASKWPPADVNSQVAVGRPLPTFEDTPRRRVMATTVVAPLEVQNASVTFKPTTDSSVLNKQIIKLSNTSRDVVTWSIGDDNFDTIKRFKDGTFKFFLDTGESFNPPTLTQSLVPGKIGCLLPNETFSFSATFTPSHRGQYSETLPLYINNDNSRPYRQLTFTADLLPERIISTPTHIAIHPIPLGVTVEAQFTVILQGFSGSVQLEASLPDDFPDGVRMSVKLPDKFERPRDKEMSVRLSCEIDFCSNIPVSITDCVTFHEKITGKIKNIPFSVCSDNSLLSVYEFISNNINSTRYRMDPDTGVPLLHLPSESHISLSHSTLCHSNASSFTTLRDSTTPHTISSCSTSYGGLFLTDCKGYLCRYLSLYGWSEGLHNIQHPTDLIQCVGKEFSNAGNLRSKGLSTSRGPLLDMIRHLCGRLPPGIPQTPPPCKTRFERITRHYQEITITLAFIRSQGGLIWIVVPESLMDWRDFSCWRETNPPLTTSLLNNVTMDEFRDISEQVWTHLLAQTMKVLVLPKLLSVIPKSLTARLNTISEQISNVYDRNELLLLAWINECYNKGKQYNITSNDRRSVLSFDVDLMDCTILASVISVHAPYMVDKYFKNMYSEPVTPEQVNHNAILLVNACRELGLNYDMQPSDLSAPHPIGLLLFTSYLFHALPSYNPQTVITFEGELGTKVTQKVKIENPSSKPLVYHTKLIGEGKDHFIVNENIKISPQSSVHFEITFTVKYLRDCSAVLLLLGKNGTGRPGRTVAFNLNGVSTLVKPTVFKSVEACLYDLLKIPIPLDNNWFNKMGCNFSVHLTEGNVLQEPVVKKKKTGKLIKPQTLPAQSVSIATSKLQSRSTDKMKLFHTATTSVTINEKEADIIMVDFIPLTMQSRQCCIVLSNPNLGDVVILINATVALPLPILPVSNHLLSSTHVNKVTKILHLKATVGEVIKEDIILQNSNNAFEAIILELSQWEMGDSERRKRTNTNSLQYASLRKAMEALNLDSSLKTHWDKMADRGSDEQHFTVESDSNLFIVPSTISVPATKHGKVVFPIQFSCKTEGRFSCRIVLRSQHDVRVYHVEAMVMDRGRTAELEIVTPALEPITQTIPINNPTTIDWPLSVVLTGRGFTGPNEFNVKALTTGYYPLTFAPRREYTTQGSLKLVNTIDNSQYYFTLKGIGKRPLAQENISIHTKAKTSIAHIIHVPNTGDRTTTYGVECDLDFISGPPTVTVAGGDVADYPIMVDPLVRGKFSGAIIFVSQSRSGFIRPTSPIVEEHLWYQLNITVDPADPIDNHIIEGHIHSQTDHSIVVNNPFSNPITLQVLLDGVGLSGPSELFIESNSHAVYTLSYTPLSIGKHKGCVLFTGREDGELTVVVNLIAKNPKPVTLGMAQCELGKSVYGSLSLINPLDQDVTFTYTTEDTHFNIVGLVDGEITVPAKSNADLSIMFKPTTLGPDHTGTLTFTSKEFGRQDFLMDGVGLFPSPQTPTTISSKLQSNSMAIITFTNPLSHTASFDINLNKQNDVFCLFLKQSKDVILESGVSLDIPIMFAPDSMIMSYTELTISTEEVMVSDDPISWIYPVHGLPETLVGAGTDTAISGGVTVIKGQAKERVEQEIETCLRILKNDYELDDSLEDLDVTIRERYVYDIVAIDNQEHCDSLKEFVGLQLVDEDQQDDNGGMKLTFNIVFLPSKPFKCKAELQIQPISNGLWRFPVLFEASEQMPDEVIILKAQHLTKETKKSFRLTSLTSEAVPFNASFASSLSELSINPSSGLLLPQNSDGTLFTVTYKPKTFDKRTNAILKIETKFSQWCYEVVGEPITYMHSSPSRSKVDHRRNVEMGKPLNRNIIRQNIECVSSHMHA